MLSDFGTEVLGELGMSNQLSMASIHSIETLHRSGHSNREIARILGIDRGAVNNYVKRLRAVERALQRWLRRSQNRFKSGQTRAPGLAVKRLASGFKTAQTCSSIVNVPTIRSCFRVSRDAVVRRDLCEQYREVIVCEAGSRAVVGSDSSGSQDRNTAFLGSYHSVRRLIDHLGLKKPLPFRRMEVNPGDEAQIDFGTAALVIDD
jgi:predicted transcriptional regulator